LRNYLPETKEKIPERGILISLALPDIPYEEAEISLDELERLVETAGGVAVARVIQKREAPHARTYVGPGKAEEIACLCRELEADLVVFDHELSPSQQRNLENILKVKVVDRTALILDIFAQHAHSKEGKLQVELAQLSYLLPRLRGRGVMLSRLGAGIGTRGPGETKLEVDRRRIKERLSHLKKELKKVAKHREVQRKLRQKKGVFNISIVGYTNAGKSTLLNSLTNASVYVEDQLFATLDSTTRKLYLNNGLEAVLSDTVGFIQKLPHQLVAAFYSTLKEVALSDLVIHVIDSSNPYLEKQMEAVERTLEEIGASEKERLEVFNKIDLIPPEKLRELKRKFPEGIFISALNKEGLPALKEEIEERTKNHYRNHLSS
jgi:GTP-binding protein HflX